jgi:hypothetical protein
VSQVGVEIIAVVGLEQVDVLQAVGNARDELGLVRFAHRFELVAPFARLNFAQLVHNGPIDPVGFEHQLVRVELACEQTLELTLVQDELTRQVQLAPIEQAVQIGEFDLI